jgi:hypothetical protein
MANRKKGRYTLSFWENAKKYFRYVFDVDAFAERSVRGEITSAALETARELRGNHPPAIIIHGIMKRSGTVYSGELLGSHPKIYPHPNRMWETPFLAQTRSIRKLQSDYSLAYRFNVDRMGENDFLPLFGSAFLAYMYSLVPEDQRMLLKVPGVEYLDYFYDVFPQEHLLLVLRDGRDLVSSTIKTWPQLRFAHVCRRWALSARMVLRFDAEHRGRPGYFMARFEDAVEDPAGFVRKAADKFGLDPDAFPVEKLGRLPVIGSSTTRKSGKTWIKKTAGFNPIGRWHNWSAWRKMRFKQIAGKELMALGYCEDLNW